MKKSLLTVITFALTFINLILTAVIAISVVPEVQNVNDLVGKVASAIDLDLEAGAVQDGSSEVPLEQLAFYTLADSVNINLKDNGDGKQHFAVVGITLSLDTESEAYGTYGEFFSSDAADKKYDSLVKSTVIDVISSFTLDELNGENKDTYRKDAQDGIRDALNNTFGYGFVTDVSFPSLTFQ